MIPKKGLIKAGPFDLRFGAAHKTQIRVGLIGTDQMLRKGRQWLEKCCNTIPSKIKNSIQYTDFPGFKSVFRASLVLDEQWVVEISNRKFEVALAKNLKDRFEEVLDLYADGVEKLTYSTETPPDIVICCLPDSVVEKCWSISSSLSPRERQLIKKRHRERDQGQMFLWDIEETEGDLLNRDFRRALKARTMKFQMPIQIATDKFIYRSFR